MGGIDWQGLDLVAELIGVSDADFELLLLGLQTIKRHEPPRKSESKE